MKIIATERLQRNCLLVCIGLGAAAGLAFATSSRMSFNLMFATFMWTLIAGSVAAIITSLNGSVKLGDWRTGLRVSAEIYFANSTGYLLALLFCAALGPAQELAGALFTFATMARIIAPGVYFATSLMTLASIFFYWLPRGQRQPAERTNRD